MKKLKKKKQTLFNSWRPVSQISTLAVISNTFFLVYVYFIGLRTKTFHTHPLLKPKMAFDTILDK